MAKKRKPRAPVPVIDNLEPVTEEEFKLEEVQEPVMKSEVVKLVPKTSVNFRKRPSLTGTVINVANRGDKFILLNRLDGGWLEVRTLHEPVVIGYLKSEFVEEV